MKLDRLPIYFCLALTLGGTLQAQEHRQEGVHEHGMAHLDLAREGGRIDLHLDSPAMNLVGYEHMPSNDGDRQVLDDTLAQLRAADRIFRFDEQADCRLIEAEIFTPLTGESGHGSVEGDVHGHGHHADIEADYRFECANPERLGRMSVDLFRLFPATHRLLVQFITDQGQGSAELTAADAELEF